MIVMNYDQQTRLTDAGRKLSEARWEIGDVSNEVLDMNGGADGARLEAFYHISQFVGLSARRVDTIARVAETFPPGIRGEWAFGYYEMACKFENPHEAIEFLEFYVEEYGKVPTITSFELLYQTHALGETKEKDTSFDFSLLVSRLRNLLVGHPNEERVLALIAEIEELVLPVTTIL